MNALNSRKLPNDLQGKPRIIGNPSAVESLFRYIKSVAQHFFVPEFQSRVFPKSLSILHQITVTKYERQKNAKKNPRSSIAVATEINNIDNKSKDLDLKPVFNQFSEIMKKLKNPLLPLTDFLILYCAYLLVVCEGDQENLLPALYFLKNILQFELPQRNQESEILASVLLKQGDSEPNVRGHSIQALSFLINYNPTILNRVKVGCEFHEKSLSEFCKDVIKFMRKKLPSDQPPPPPTFAQISPSADLTVCDEMMTSFITAIENGEKPRDICGFIHNIAQTMQRFIDSPVILGKGANNIGLALNLLLPSPPIETVSEAIKLCFSLLSGESFLTGNDSFDALEAIQSLSNNIFEIIPTELLIPAISATIATTDESHIHLLLRKFSEYYQNNRSEINQRQLTEIASTLDAFHPSFTERPSFLKINIGFDNRLAQMTNSIEKLMNPETVFTEMENVIQQDPAILNDYPLYLRGFLQRAYLLYNGEEPVGMSDEQKQLADEMMQDINSINEEDLMNGGKFSLESLSAQLEEMKAYNSSSW